MKLTLLFVLMTTYLFYVDNYSVFNFGNMNFTLLYELFAVYVVYS